MKKSTQTFLTIALFLGFVSTGFASSTNDEFVSESNKRLQKYQTMVSAKTAIRYSGTLLERSTVAQKLKFSGDASEKAHYENAIDTYKDALKAFELGNNEEAKKLSLQAIRIIASTVPRHYSRVAKLNQ